MLVLEVISGLCRDPLALVEMFVNYDCDLQAIDLFKRIATALAKVCVWVGGAMRLHFFERLGGGQS